MLKSGLVIVFAVVASAGIISAEAITGVVQSISTAPTIDASAMVQLAQPGAEPVWLHWAAKPIRALPEECQDIGAIWQAEVEKDIVLDVRCQGSIRWCMAHG